jgi:hypothetical protein
MTQAPRRRSLATAMDSSPILATTSPSWSPSRTSEADGRRCSVLAPPRGQLALARTLDLASLSCFDAELNGLAGFPRSPTSVPVRGYAPGEAPPSRPRGRPLSAGSDCGRLRPTCWADAGLAALWLLQYVDRWRPSIRQVGAGGPGPGDGDARGVHGAFVWKGARVDEGSCLTRFAIYTPVIQMPDGHRATARRAARRQRDRPVSHFGAAHG